MRAHKDFIVHIPERYHEGIKTENGTKIHLDSRFSGKEVANTIVEVVSVPMIYNGDIKPGCRLLIDPIVVHTQEFQKWGTEENHHLVDRDKKLYKIDPSLVICYSLEGSTQWRGFEDNVICEYIKPPKQEEKELEKIGSIFIPDMTKPKPADGPVVKIIIANDALNDQGIYEDDVVFYKPTGVYEVWLRDQKVVGLKNKYLLGKLLKEAV